MEQAEQDPITVGELARLLARPYNTVWVAVRRLGLVRGPGLVVRAGDVAPLIAPDGWLPVAVAAVRLNTSDPVLAKRARRAAVDLRRFPLSGPGWWLRDADLGRLRGRERLEPEEQAARTREYHREWHRRHYREVVKQDPERYAARLADNRARCRERDADQRLRDGANRRAKLEADPAAHEAAKAKKLAAYHRDMQDPAKAEHIRARQRRYYHEKTKQDPAKVARLRERARRAYHARKASPAEPGATP